MDDTKIIPLSSNTSLLILASGIILQATQDANSYNKSDFVKSTILTHST